MQSHLDTAVLLFSLSVGEEFTSKELLGEAACNFDLLSRLNKRVSKIAKRSSLPVILSNEVNQVGDSFGERLSNAIENVFAKGYASVIVVGNDCPDLNQVDISNAKELLRTSDLVIGPDHRGGTYLMGLSKESFQKDAFSRLNWQTQDLVSSLKAYSFSNFLEVSELNRKADLNTKKDIGSYWSLSRTLRRLINLVLSELHIPSSRPIFIPATVYAAPHNRRGP